MMLIRKPWQPKTGRHYNKFDKVTFSRVDGNFYASAFKSRFGSNLFGCPQLLNVKIKMVHNV